MASRKMDTSVLFTSLYAVCEQAVAALSEEPNEMAGDSAKRLIEVVTLIHQHGRGLEPVIAGFTATFHHFDFDPLVPGNGYRSLVKVVRSCLLHIIQKGRYITTNCRKLLFRAPHNTKEMEAYCSALCQLRALLYLAQRLLHDNDQGDLYFQKEGGLSAIFTQEYASMYKACFYGRCLGFQFSPAIRPFLQTVVTGLVSFGENYKKHKSLFVEAGGITQYGVAASSFFTSGKYVVDPELRGTEYERAIQNMDMQFWKTFWNLSETELISGLASIMSVQVQVNRTLSVPPMSFLLPLASDPQLSVTVAPPVAHCGPGPVNMRLISHKLLEGQNSEEMLAFSHTEGTPISMSLGLTKPSPPSPWLLVHFHGGGFVAHTSKSHENYLKSWAQDLGMPILSVDYSLAPEAPFPRALEECFYAYCWALKHCHLLGSTAERVCLAGDSAGGNLCITVAMRAMSQGVRVPDGIMAAYPATLLTTYASPSRLLTLIDPLLPLGVIYKCLSAYAGTEPQTGTSETEGTMKTPTDTVSSPPSDPSQDQTSQDPGSEKHQAENPSEGSVVPPSGWEEYPEGFRPLRSEQLADISLRCSPINRNPYVSPLLAPDSMLQGLPPVHIVACALDAMLDDSVMFARRLRRLQQPVTLCVVEDLPHGFLCLQHCKETQEANSICVARIREVFSQRHGNTNQDAPPALGETNPETDSSNEEWTRNTGGRELAAGDGQNR
ncbi:hormone-sensitive lipase-like isoform X1 [Conger conger]|uniref:hormone-sensitive lipase-like isoform X1 n=1 Tax=Conger conger TaxID=82655 RepID=UPI002A5AB6EF|nr:hormone-sensitive lipase-like isoform X1 [Conger conger]